jgi:CheY-like chemotaxis protein/two-component sensor histidine kinase
MLLGTLPEGSHEYENAMGIYGASQRAGELVKQILSFSRQTEHQKTPVRIQRLLKEVVKLSRSTIPSNIEIHTDIQKNCGLVMADPVQIHQIAMNLITNAYHATEDNGGQITISLAELKLSKKDTTGAPLLPGRYAVLTVSDTGNGIDPAVMNRIFEPYFTTKPKGKGTGLGLSMIYGIVKEHGGHVEVSSQLGKGSQFIVYLPLMDIPSEKKRDVIPDEITGGNERILLVDDEEVVAKLEALILKSLGYDVTMYTSSTDALAAFRSDPNRFDLVISDMTMPNMTGDKLAVELLSIRPGLPIIICTGFSEKMNMEKADTIGIKGLLFKPALKTEMAKKIREVIDSTAG